MEIINPIDADARDQWALLKWEYMETVQDSEPNLWLGWYDLVTLFPVSPNGGIYVYRN